MKTYMKKFCKTVYGWTEVEANSKKEAEEKILNGEGDEFDNKSDYIFEDTVEK